MSSTAPNVDQDADLEAMPPIHWITPEEARRQFDEETRARLGMSGEEFIRRLDAGEFEDIPDDEEHRAYIELGILSTLGR